MIDLTTPLVTQVGNDMLVQGNWLQLPLCDNSIDAVVGDKVLGNVMPSEWPELFADVKRVLRPGGTFITRASPHGEYLLEPPPRRAFRDLVSKWASFQREGMKLDDACSGLWEDCMDMSTEHVTPYIGTQQLIRVIPPTEIDCITEAGSDPGNILLVERFVQKYWPSRDARWSAYTLESIKTAARDYFDYVGKYAASDYPEGNRQPVFHFIRRA
jgi:SAM-dependent methyltransferase